MTLVAGNPLSWALPPTPKRRAFVSYHHGNDQAWYDLFSLWYGDAFDLFTNRSLTEPVDSDDVDYVHRAIRELNITGTSITIVLCGSGTWRRKWVDWEIGSTINKGHALLGIGLPTVSKNWDGSASVPDRLLVNYQNGYAPWLAWDAISAERVRSVIEDAVWRSSSVKPDNSLPFMRRNRP